jgi:plastocyanin
VTIAISGMLGANSYSPSPVTVQVGQQVRWRNDDSTAHTATRSGAGGFDTGVINPGQTSAPITITTAGTINYVCTLHPGMTGVLNVQ